MLCGGLEHGLWSQINHLISNLIFITYGFVRQVSSSVKCEPLEHDLLDRAVMMTE